MFHRLEPSSVKTKDQQGNAKILNKNAKEREDASEAKLIASDNRESVKKYDTLIGERVGQGTYRL